MSLQELQAQKLSEQWATQIAQRMASKNEPQAAIEETTLIISNLVHIAIKDLQTNTSIDLPDMPQPLELDKTRAMLILNLFVRAISRMAATLRKVETPKPLTWNERSPIIEKLAWPTLNLAKVVVAHYVLPNKLNNTLKSEADLHVLLQKSALELLEGALPKGIKLPKNKNKVKDKKGSAPLPTSQSMAYQIASITANNAQHIILPEEDRPFTPHNDAENKNPPSK